MKRKTVNVRVCPAEKLKECILIQEDIKLIVNNNEISNWFFFSFLANMFFFTFKSTRLQPIIKVQDGGGKAVRIRPPIKPCAGTVHCTVYSTLQYS